MKHRPHLSPRMFRVLTGPACIFNAKLPPAIFPAISFIASHSTSLLFIFLTPRKFYIPCFAPFFFSFFLSLLLSFSLFLFLFNYINIAIEIPSSFDSIIIYSFTPNAFFLSFFLLFKREKFEIYLDLRSFLFFLFFLLFSSRDSYSPIISSASIFVVKRFLFLEEEPLVQLISMFCSLLLFFYFASMNFVMY